MRNLFQPGAVVLGAGALGLTTALFLSEAGIPVRVVAHRPPHLTTSAVAGAIWGPYIVNDDRALRWSLVTLDKLCELAGDADSGIRMVSGLEAATRPASPPEWVRAMADFAPAASDELPGPYVCGWHYSIPVVDMTIYLGYLTKRLADHGVEIELIDPLVALDPLFDVAGAIVNCSGLGARELVPDPFLYPIQGQLLVVDNPGIESFFLDHLVARSSTYFFPHPDHVVLGGTAVPYVDGIDPDPRVGAEIRSRCAVIEPALAAARIREHRIGLRPARRPSVRLERVVHEGGIVIHNYGHGGSGITLSWGCAADVRDLLG